MLISAVSPRTWFLYAAASMVLSAVLYFAVLHNTNQQIDRTTDAVTRQIDQATRNAGAPGVGKAVDDLAKCIMNAGTDLSKAQACQVKFGG